MSRLLKVEGFGDREARVRAHAWVSSARSEGRSIFFMLRNGMHVVRYKYGEPNQRYFVLDPIQRGDALVGRRRTFEAAMRLALEHRMYAQALVVPQHQELLKTKSATVYAGSNSVQFFWQNANGKVALIRNRQEQQWWAMEDGLLVPDQEALEREKALNPSLHSITLSSPTAEGLAGRLAALGLQIRFDESRVWSNARLQIVSKSGMEA